MCLETLCEQQDNGSGHVHHQYTTKSGKSGLAPQYEEPYTTRTQTVLDIEVPGRDAERFP
jgi:hypothetical protein